MNPQEKGKVPPSASPFPDPSTPENTVRKLNIVLAEDSASDTFIVREALAHYKIDAELTCHRDGGEMFRYIERIDAGEVPCPDVILLDLNLPRHSGQAILARMRKSPLCRDVPVIVVTSSKSLSEQEEVFRLGATKYFHKSIDYDESMRLGAVVLEVTQEKGSA